MTALTTDTLVNAYERRITWTLLTGALTDILDSSDPLGDGSGWSHGYILTDKDDTQVWLNHADAAGTPDVRVFPGGSGGTAAILVRDATSASVGVIEKWSPQMKLKNTNAGTAVVTLVLHRDPVLGVNKRKSFEV